MARRIGPRNNACQGGQVGLMMCCSQAAMIAMGSGRASLRSVGPSGRAKLRISGLDNNEARHWISAVLANHDKAWIMVLGFWRVEVRSSLELVWHEWRKSMKQAGWMDDIDGQS